MDDASLYLVVIAVKDADRRRNLRKILDTFGEAIGRDTYEVPASPRAMVRLRKSLEPELELYDELRIYPVCARCRERAQAHGTEGFATTPLCWIF